MQKIARIVLKVIAGFFLYSVMFIGFFSAPSFAAKLGILGVFLFLAAVPMLVDLAMDGFSHWKWDLGIVFVSSAAFSAFMAMSVALVMTTPEFQRQSKPGTSDFFSDYIFGITLILLVGGLGGLLLLANKSESKQQVSELS